jgi:hypothetical protein
MDYSPEHNVHGEAEIVHSHCVNGADLNDSGIIYHHVEASETLNGLLDHALNLKTIRDIAGNGEDSRTARREIPHSGFEFLRTACAEHELTAAPRKLARQRQAQTTRAPSDQDYFAAPPVFVPG